MALKVALGTKTGKTFQKELSQEEAESLYGKVLGEELRGELLGYSGVTFTITGGSDANGFPMRKDLPGINRKKILMTKGTGFKGKLRGKRFGGLRIKKTVAGNTVYEKTHQLNLKVVKGDEVVEKAFAPAEEPAAAEE
ncbi:MAG: S6e family ribosomal protein [Nanoarchaeota archaeon]|nr:S6e family ribosomal protein [Nanoarchaeota archaeon]